jgi:S-adenosylmethionine decarboxylase
MMGREWIVDAHGCDPAALTDERALSNLFDAMVAGLALRPVRPATWHVFPGAGGITGLLLLAESHLTCHTFPEHGSLCLNLFCCRPREDWDFDRQLASRFGAHTVHVRRVDRPYGSRVDASGRLAGAPEPPSALP